MSRFIANQISFSKDFSSFKVKGGDSNVVPRSNEWTDYIPLSELYYYVSGNMIELSNNYENMCFVNVLVSEHYWGGNWENNSTYYHVHNNSANPPEVSEKLKKFDENFTNELIEGLKSLSSKKEYIVNLGGRYVNRQLPMSCKVTYNRSKARLYSKYRAKQVSSRHNESVVETY